MSKKTRHPVVDDFQDAEMRVAEILRLFASIRQLLANAADAFDKPDSDTPKSILSKLSDLQSAHIIALKAEEAFHEKFTSQGQSDIIDFDTIRHDLGRQLDRIRAAVDSA